MEFATFCYLVGLIGAAGLMVAWLKEFWESRDHFYWEKRGDYIHARNKEMEGEVKELMEKMRTVNEAAPKFPPPAGDEWKYREEDD